MPPPRLLTVLLAGLLAVPVAAAPVAAGSPAQPAGHIGVRLVDPPRGDDPRAQIYVVDHVQPGGTARRRLEVVNTTGRAADVALYAGAAHVRGGHFVASDADTVGELSSWTTVRPAQVRVPAGGRATADVTIAVPRTASGGERYGVVWAEHRGAPGGGVTAVSRVGVRTYLSVGGPSEPSSDFAVEGLTAVRTQEGEPVVRARVRNSGGRALDLQGSLGLTDGPGGSSAGPFPVEGGTTLAVGASAEVIVRLDPGLPPGPWRGRLQMTSGTVTRSVEGLLTFPEAGAPAVPVVLQEVTDAPPADGRVLRWAGLLLLGLLLALLLWLLLVRRRPEDQQQPEEEPAPPLAAPPLPAPQPAPLPPPLPRPRRAPVGQRSVPS